MTEQDSADSLYAAGGPGDSGVAELGITVFKEILLQAKVIESRDDRYRLGGLEDEFLSQNSPKVQPLQTLNIF